MARRYTMTNIELAGAYEEIAKLARALDKKIDAVFGVDDEALLKDLGHDEALNGTYELAQGAAALAAYFFAKAEQDEAAADADAARDDRDEQRRVDQMFSQAAE